MVKKILTIIIAVLSAAGSSIETSAPTVRCRAMWAVTTAYTSAHGEIPGSKTCVGEFPRGTLLIVPEYGDCVVRGRMGASFRRYWHVNLRFGGHDRARAAREWGRRRQQIVVCEYAPGGESP